MRKVFIETFGCQMNVSDSERAAATLEKRGFDVVRDEASADVVVINTCSVREKAENKLYTRVGEIRKLSSDKIVGVMGCVAQLEGADLLSAGRGIDFVVGTRATNQVPDLIEARLLHGEEVLDLNDWGEPDWYVSPAQRHSRHVAFLPIIEGCNKFCTYCIVPFSRGRERSVAAQTVLMNLNRLHSEDVKEVHLIGQNVNSYRPGDLNGLDNFRGATPFSSLLRAAAASMIPRIKFATSFPRDFHPDIVDAINENESLCNWVHLPVQSGSDRILASMRRGHTSANYKRRIDQIKMSDRKIALTTDLIVGFPGETDQDFRETLELAEYCKFDAAYIFKYSRRPGTPAAALPDEPGDEVKTARFRELECVVRRSQSDSLRACVGRLMKVLVEGKSAKSSDDLVGHTTCHRVVNFAGSAADIGNVVDVKITSSKTNTLFGVRV
jgi:tRNA-2-methylthio-N6-dimethylallyladenosine synthase